MISTKIVSEYLNEIQFTNQWLDARDYVKTDNSYREGVVDWAKTEEFISHLNSEICYVTQGFIGSDDNNFTVTLGREGSDYSAAIFAYCLDAELMTIWKDVPGVMTGDRENSTMSLFFPTYPMKKLLRWPITGRVLFTQKHYSHYNKKIFLSM